MDYKKINKNVLKVLEVLRRDKLYFNQIWEKTEIKSKNGLLDLLNELTENKILLKEKNKSNTFYEINFNNPLTIAILNLIDKNKFEYLPFQVKKSILESVFKLKPKLAILFGSYAKNNYSKNSDIDLIFVSSEKKSDLIKECSSKYGVEINIIFVSDKEFDSTDEQIKHILTTGYPIVGGEYFYHEYSKK